MTARDLVLLALVLALLLAWPLASPSIITRGEAREALVVQDLVQGGDWLLPRRLGELASKPPLFHWIAATGARVFGLSDVTVRLPSALAAWTMAAATLALGMRIGGRLVGWLAVGVLLGMAVRCRERHSIVAATTFVQSLRAWTHDRRRYLQRRRG